MAEKRLKVLIVGASGTLGRAVAAELKKRHDVVSAGSASGDFKMNLDDPQSIRDAFLKIGKVDAVVCTAGKTAFVPLSEIKAEPIGKSVYTLGLANKLMGQVNLALTAREFLNDHGSVTLTTGVLADQFIAAGSAASMVNGAVEAFTRAAAIELERGLRINVVSPNLLTESAEGYGPLFRGFEPVPAARAALGYSRSVEGKETGQVYKIH